MNDRLLGDVTVVDCGEGIAAGTASRILGDLGARVIKVEPPGGDRLRHLGPAPLFAQHNNEVLAGVAGLGAEAIAELRDSGALADEPTNLHLFRRAP